MILTPEGTVAGKQLLPHNSPVSWLGRHGPHAEGRRRKRGSLHRNLDGGLLAHSKFGHRSNPVAIVLHIIRQTATTRIRTVRIQALRAIGVEADNIVDPEAQHCRHTDIGMAIGAPIKMLDVCAAGK